MAYVRGQSKDAQRRTREEAVTSAQDRLSLLRERIQASTRIIDELTLKQADLKRTIAEIEKAHGVIEQLHREAARLTIQERASRSTVQKLSDGLAVVESEKADLTEQIAAEQMKTRKAAAILNAAREQAAKMIEAAEKDAQRTIDAGQIKAKFIRERANRRARVLRENAITDGIAFEAKRARQRLLDVTRESEEYDRRRSQERKVA